MEEETKEKEIVSREYELAYILSSKLNEEESAGMQRTIQNLIEQLGGLVTNARIAEKKALAFPIKKEKMGYFGFFELTIDPENILPLTQKLRLEHEILRFLPIQLDRKKMEKTAAPPRRRRPARKLFTEEVPAKTEVTTKEKKVQLEELEKKLEELLEN